MRTLPLPSADRRLPRMRSSARALLVISYPLRFAVRSSALQIDRARAHESSVRRSRPCAQASLSAIGGGGLLPAGALAARDARQHDEGAHGGKPGFPRDVPGMLSGGGPTIPP
jgi:hypothetical protein